MEEFFDGSDVIVEAMASATIVATGEVFVEASVSLVESDLAKGLASIEEKTPKEFGPTFAKFSTPPKGGASPMGSETEEVPFATPLLIISLNDPFTTLP